MEDEAILTSTLNVGEKNYRALLTNSSFTLYSKEDNQTDTEGVAYYKISLQDVFAVTYEPETEKSKKVNKSDDAELLPTNKFAIHSVAKRRNHKLKTKNFICSCQDAHLCQKWVENFTKILSGFNRPKNLLIFVNPFGGKKQAVKIFHEKASPLFSLAGIKQEVIVTERGMHAHSVIMNAELDSFDGIVSVGGDGMFNEVLNGVLFREDSSKVSKPKIKLGIIPAGSTDAVAFSTTGINDPVTSALHIILGDNLPIDICSVWHDEKLLKYSAALMGYGFYGDVIKRSDGLRWMGPKRYVYAVFQTIMANRTYAGEVSFLPAPTTQERSQQNERCVAGCQRCLEDDPSINSEDVNAWKTIRGRFFNAFGANIACRSAMALHGISPNTHLGDGYFDLILIRKLTRRQYLRYLSSSNHLDFDFIEVFKVKEVKFHPIQFNSSQDEEENHDDQNNDLISSDVTGRSLSSGRRNEQHSVWMIDGELIDETNVHIRNHRKLITLFANGIEEMDEETPTCGRC